MSKYLLIFLGAGAGGALRVAAGGLVQRALGSSFPYGTLAVNVSGCLAMGFLAVALSGDGTRDAWRVLLLAGLLGGYTTFSAFGLEALALVEAHHWRDAASYVLLSVVLGLGATWLGSLAAMRLLPHAR